LQLVERVHEERFRPKHCPLRAAAPRAVHSREHLAYCAGLPVVRL
jgi:hypothetical protein